MVQHPSCKPRECVSRTLKPRRCAPFCASVSANQFPLQQSGSFRRILISAAHSTDSYLRRSGAGTVERSLLMARSTVRFISETTPGTFR